MENLLKLIVLFDGELNHEVDEINNALDFSILSEKDQGVFVIAVKMKDIWLHYDHKFISTSYGGMINEMNQLLPEVEKKLVFWHIGNK